MYKWVMMMGLFAAIALRAEAYEPVKKDVEGWPVFFEPVLFEGEHKETGEKALKALANHLYKIKLIVPEERLKELQKLEIRVELHNKRLGAMQYHPSEGWLKRNGHDPSMVKQPWVILHELAHAYHDQVLGFDHKGIIEAYQRGKKNESYDKVLLYTGRRVKHYAMTNHKEFFAELTEAYFGMNDFYPFVRAEIKEHDPETFKLLEEIWGKLR